MNLSLRERQEMFEVSSDFKMLPHIPVLIRITLKNYKKLAEEVEQPYSLFFSELMSETMLYLTETVQDAVFGFCHGDEINLVLRNDLSKNSKPWFNNDIQKIVSSVASTITLGFLECQDMFDDEPFLGAGLFDVKVFNVPSLPEVVNYLVLRQSYCMGNALNSACYSELSRKIDRGKVSSLLRDKTYDQKKQLLLKHSDIDFIDYYPMSFYRGMACYKEPTLVPTNNGSETKNKWTINQSIPNFVEDKDFLLNIITNGHDVFRGRSLSDITYES